MEKYKLEIAFIKHGSEQGSITMWADTLEQMAQKVNRTYENITLEKDVQIQCRLYEAEYIKIM